MPTTSGDHRQAQGKRPSPPVGGFIPRRAPPYRTAGGSSVGGQTALSARGENGAPNQPDVLSKRVCLAREHRRRPQPRSRLGRSHPRGCRSRGSRGTRAPPTAAPARRRGPRDRGRAGVPGWRDRACPGSRGAAGTARWRPRATDEFAAHRARLRQHLRRGIPCTRFNETCRIRTSCSGRVPRSCWRRPLMPASRCAGALRLPSPASIAARSSAPTSGTWLRPSGRRSSRPRFSFRT